jgi:phospholipid/cholesterol/gamma-HCH transport system substrate-binding protein
MKDWKAGIKVGVVVLVVVALSYYGFRRIHEGVSGSEGYTVFARFEDATGLVDKSRVVIAGLRVGQIVKKKLKGKKAAVYIYIEGDYKLYANACVFKKSASIMGEYYLELDPGTPRSPNKRDPEGPPIKNEVLKDGSEITCVHEAATMDELVNQLNKATPEIRKLATEVRGLVKGEITDTVKTTRKAIAVNAKALNRLLERADSIARDFKQMTGPIPRDVRQIVRNIRVITDRTRHLTHDVKDLLQSGKGEVTATGEKLRKTLKRIDDAVAKLDKALTQGPGISRDVRGITKDIKKVTGMVAEGRGNLGKFLTDETIADNVKKTVADVKTFVGGVTRLKTIVGLRTEYNVMARSLKTYVAIRLQPKANKYYLIELIDDPRGRTTSEEVITRQGGPDGPIISHTSTKKLENKFRFSFMFAKRVDFATFRFGIKESWGGVGLDLHFLDDTLNFTTDVFDFSANDYPRLKFTVSWNFFKRFSLVGGVDDVLNSSGALGAGIGRDYFVGAQLVFNDEDLKTLLMVGGSAVGSLASQ